MRNPVTVSILLKMYSCLNFKYVSHVLFWAMVLLPFGSLLRVCHVVKSPHTLKFTDVILGEHGFLLRVRSSKTSRIPHDISIAGVKDKRLCAFYWHRVWLSRRPVRSLYLFSDKLGDPLSYQYFYQSLAKLVSHAGVKSNITSHSFRHGGASFLASLGVPFLKIKERGWRSNTVFSYLPEPLDSTINSALIIHNQMAKHYISCKQGSASYFVVIYLLR